MRHIRRFSTCVHSAILAILGVKIQIFEKLPKHYIIEGLSMHYYVCGIIVIGSLRIPTESAIKTECAFVCHFRALSRPQQLSGSHMANDSIYPK